jgi:uncharacterized sporulation protein YeaH/YhbH (DUF444 family)
MYRFGQDLIIDQSTMNNDRTLSSEGRLRRRIEGIVKKQIDELVKQRGVTDLASSGPVKVKAKLDEPSFEFDRETGSPQFVIVGNPVYVKGDEIAKPPRGWTRKRGRSASPEDDGSMDEYVFNLDSKEIEDRLFEQLKLPNLDDRKINRRMLESREHAGFTTEGPPATLDLGRTIARSMGRRIALGRPSLARLQALEAEIARIEALLEDDPERERLPELHEELRRMKEVRHAVPFLDKPDLQHRRTEIVRKPVTSAVVFALMDVSISMTEHHKELAKRFFWLLRKFLQREYDQVRMVWIRHTSEAEECDEKTFFYDQHTGGTIVSSALELMIDIRKDRYPLDQWNAYMCQASDGDTGISVQNPRHQNLNSRYAPGYVDDATYSAALMERDILPILQYCAYLECRHKAQKQYDDKMETELWRSYSGLTSGNQHFVMRQVHEAADIYPVFRNLFAAA